MYDKNTGRHLSDTEIKHNALQAVIDEQQKAIEAGHDPKDVLAIGTFEDGNQNERFSSTDVTNVEIKKQANEFSKLSNTELGIRLAKLVSARQTNTEEFHALERVRKQRLGLK